MTSLSEYQTISQLLGDSASAKLPGVNGKTLLENLADGRGRILSSHFETGNATGFDGPRTRNSTSGICVLAERASLDLKSTCAFVEGRSGATRACARTGLANNR